MEVNGYAIVSRAPVDRLLALSNVDLAVRHVTALSDGRVFVAVDGLNANVVGNALARLGNIGTLDQAGSGDWPYPPEVPPDSVPWPMAPRVKKATRAYELYVWERFDREQYDALLAVPFLEGALTLHDGSTVAYFSDDSIRALAVVSMTLHSIKPDVDLMWASGQFARRTAVLV